jgi:CheY-like chemotaxis protein
MNDKNILLAMKASVFRDDLIFMMGTEGFHIDTASNGSDAFEKIKQYTIDGVVTELDLPQWDALELVLSIRDLKMIMPIIVISFDNQALKTEILQAGASAFLHHPKDASVVIDFLTHEKWSQAI